MQFKRVGIVDEPLEVRLKPGIHGLDLMITASNVSDVMVTRSGSVILKVKNKM
jgi:hypothetical protein